MKKYEISFCCAPTGSCWSYEANTIKEVESILRMNHNISYAVDVYDHQLNDFIFWRDAFCYEPHIDLIHNRKRDLRTKTRMEKES